MAINLFLDEVFSFFSPNQNNKKTVRIRLPSRDIFYANIFFSDTRYPNNSWVCAASIDKMVQKNE